MRKRAHDILFWSLVALAAAMLTGLLLVVGGVVPVESAQDEPSSIADRAPAAAPEPVVRTTQKVEPQQPVTKGPAATTPAKSSPATLVVVTASRGDSWFSARLGSQEGRVLDERVLAQGESVRLRGERIWLTVGAAGNVDLTVNGKPRDIEPGTVELVLSRRQSGPS